MSPTRLIIVLAVVCGLAAASVLVWGKAQDSAAAGQGRQWFGSYVDATSTPFYDIGGNVAPGERVVLAFAVADLEEPCQPSWGSFYTMDSAAETFDLDRRAARVREAGGEIVVSTGGLLNDEPATACSDPLALRAAYAALLDRYESKTLDLDIEGDDLTDADGGERRALAVAGLQSDRAAGGEPLEVWLTLPAATFGLTGEGLAEVDRMLDAGVDLAGVNLMTMNYGESRAPGDSMADAAIQTARSAHAQLAQAYAGRDERIGEQSLWRKIGLTPMIGQNDLLGEILTTDDAEALNRFAVEVNVGRMSFWSANRDQACGPNFPDATRVSNNCSGTAQTAGEFAQILSRGIGKAAPANRAPASSAPAPAPVESAIVDNPATSPYPVWNQEATFVEGDRAVWRGNVYEAKWWNEDVAPDAPVGNAGVTPWTLVGPVLPGDKPRPVVAAPAGLYPEWSPTDVYVKRDRIVFDGRVMESKWWNTAQSPEAAMQGSQDSPWKLLNNVEVQAILDAQESASAPAKHPVPSKTPAPSKKPAPATASSPAGKPASTNPSP